MMKTPRLDFVNDTTTKKTKTGDEYTPERDPDIPQELRDRTPPEYSTERTYNPRPFKQGERVMDHGTFKARPRESWAESPSYASQKASEAWLALSRYVYRVDANGADTTPATVMELSAAYAYWMMRTMEEPES